MLKLVRKLFGVISRTGPFVKLPDHRAITLGPGVTGVWVEPTPELVTGELETFVRASGIEPCRIPGYWLFKKGRTVNIDTSLGPDEKIVYALHGGAYVRLSAHPSDMTANIAKGFLQYAPNVTRVFSIEYRLSVGKPHKPANPFPAALLDALAGYSYLINVLGFSPSDVIIEGDSAGGNLALALVRHLVENKDNPSIKLPPVPGGLILLSPWCDLSKSHVKAGSSAYTCLSSDYIATNYGSTIDYATTSFVGPFGIGATENNRYISPASLDLVVSFAGYPRTFIVAGGAEVLLDQIRTLKTKMERDLGRGLVEYYEAEDAFHDYLVFVLHEPERSATYKAISSWIETM